MSQKGTLDSRLKQIRKELSLIDKDLKSLSGVASDSSSVLPKPRIRSKELRAKLERRAAPKVDRQNPVKTKARGQSAPQQPVSAPSPGKETNQDERFLEYLSSSFNSGRPMRQERRIQRNKAVLMLIIVLFILFLVLYSMSL